MKNIYQWAVFGVIVAVSAGLSVWDYFLLKDEVAGNTISAVMNETAPYTAAVLGYLMGHLFFPKLADRPSAIRFRPSHLAALSAGAALVATTWVASVIWPQAAAWVSFGGFSLGTLVGGLAWPNYGNQGD